MSTSFNKGISIVVGIIVILLIAILIGGIFFYQSQKKPREEGEKPEITLPPEEEVTTEKKPKEVVKIWHESIINEDWEQAFTYTIDENGESLSGECKEKFKKFYNSWVGTDYSLKTDAPITCDQSPMITSLLKTIGMEIPEGVECMSVPYTLSMPTFALEDEKPLLKVGEEWKVWVNCSFFP